MIARYAATSMTIEHRDHTGQQSVRARSFVRVVFWVALAAIGTLFVMNSLLVMRVGLG